MDKTLVIDGNNLLMRALFAAQNKIHLSVEVDGQEVNTGPLLLFANLISKYVRQESPERVVVCWDGGRSAHRAAIYPAYKESRKDASAEKDMTPFALAKAFLTLSGIHHIQMDDVGADDLVAAYWHSRREFGIEIVIVSGDKDFLQLLDRPTIQIRPGAETPEAERWGAEKVVDKMGCLPSQIPAVMALTGDSGDGVPGIPGFGLKTAIKFLTKYDWSLEDMLDASEPRLKFQAPAVMRNLALVDLRTPIAGIRVPEPPRFAPTVPSSLLYGDLVAWLQHLRMESISSRLSNNTLWK